MLMMVKMQGLFYARQQVHLCQKTSSEYD